MTAAQVKQLLRDRGWAAVDLAARWQISVTWMSRLVNRPQDRPAMYEDAFTGLPARQAVQVTREGRHNRARKRPGWTLAQMFPKGRIFVAIDSAVVDEGTRLAVLDVAGQGDAAHVRFEFLEGGEQAPLPVPAGQAALHFADLGLDKPESKEKQLEGS